MLASDRTLGTVGSCTHEGLGPPEMKLVEILQDLPESLVENEVFQKVGTLAGVCIDPGRFSRQTSESRRLLHSQRQRIGGPVELR